MMEAAIGAGAADVESDLGEDGSGHTVYTAFEDLNEVATALEKAFGEASSTKIIWRPKSTVTVEGENVATLMRLLDALEDDDDVQNVYSNEEISDADMAKLG
jgi:transcriptional/translational regulatory protein YebC/TACO1